MIDTIYMIINSGCVVAICFVIIDVINRQKYILREIEKIKNEK